MKVTCKNCGKSYKFDPAKIKGDKAKFKCPHCKSSMTVHKPTAPPPGEAGVANGPQSDSDSGLDFNTDDLSAFDSLNVDNLEDSGILTRGAPADTPPADAEEYQAPADDSLLQIDCPFCSAPFYLDGTELPEGDFYVTCPSCNQEMLIQMQPPEEQGLEHAIGEAGDLQIPPDAFHDLTVEDTAFEEPPDLNAPPAAEKPPTAEKPPATVKPPPAPEPSAVEKPIAAEKPPMAEEPPTSPKILPPPVLSPKPGVYTSTIKVTFGCDIPDAVIRYTLDGKEPDDKSPAYEAPVTVHESLTITAKAFLTDWAPSEAASAQYIITGQVAAVAFSPEPGTFTSEQQAALSCGTPDAVIRYTLDGSEPNETSTAYEAPVTVHESLTITAKAFLTDWAPSEAASAQYIITGSVGAVTFFPEPGTFTSEQQVALSCGTPDAVIRYTLDGSEPNETSTAYEAPVTVHESLTITAKAFLTDWAPSEAASAQYIITGSVGAVAFSPEPGTFTAEQQVALSCGTPDAVIRYTLDGKEPDDKSPAYESPVTVHESLTITAKAFLTDWAPSEAASAQYTSPASGRSGLFSGARHVHCRTTGCPLLRNPRRRYPVHTGRQGAG